MSFEHKDGSFSLFKNERKEKETQPDYTGSGKDLNGNAIQVAAWLKEGKNGKYMSCKLSEPRQKQERTNEPPPFDDDLPF